VRCAILVVNGQISGLTVRCCEHFLQRARGRLGASAHQRQQAWRLSPCAAVHTLWLREPIDVAFCDTGGQIVRVVAPLAINRWAWQRGAASTWELPAGWSDRLGLKPGDRLSLCG
jgi:uncharacterized membrane protein (UPF0127 family)